MNPLTITLTPAQAAGLRARCAEFGMSPEALISRFISDLTGAVGNGGSDERDYAAAWAERSLTFGRRPTSQRSLERYWRIQEAAFAAIRAEEASYLAGIRQGGAA